MPKVIHVKSARKPDEKFGIKVGDEYWWAGFKTGPTSSIVKKWKHYPKQSELTTSPFKIDYYSLLEDIESVKDAKDLDDLESIITDIVSRVEELRDTAQESLDNMPEHLQESSGTGQLLSERVLSCEDWISNLEQIDLSFDEEEEDKEKLEEFIEQIKEEILGADPGLE